MAALPRSEVSFRRQGSSGLVWDDKFLSGELNQLAKQQKEERDNRKSQAKSSSSSKPQHTQTEADDAGSTIQRSRSNGGRGAYRTGRVSPAIEPPSPKVSACGFCGAFGKNNKTRRPPNKPGKRVM